MPWAELLALIEPPYPKGEKGRPPVGLSILLRLYFVQHWFALSDPAAEDALYDSAALRPCGRPRGDTRALRDLHSSGAPGCRRNVRSKPRLRRPTRPRS